MAPSVGGAIANTVPRALSPIPQIASMTSIHLWSYGGDETCLKSVPDYDVRIPALRLKSTPAPPAPTHLEAHGGDGVVVAGGEVGVATVRT
jgi:hypothetical protein